MRGIFTNLTTDYSFDPAQQYCVIYEVPEARENCGGLRVAVSQNLSLALKLQVAPFRKTRFRRFVSVLDCMKYSFDSKSHQQMQHQRNVIKVSVTFLLIRTINFCTLNAVTR